MLIPNQGRLIVVPVGGYIDYDSVMGWASYPAEENVMAVDEFPELQQKITNFLADLCSGLQSRPWHDRYCGRRRQRRRIGAQRATLGLYSRQVGNYKFGLFQNLCLHHSFRFQRVRGARST